MHLKRNSEVLNILTAAVKKFWGISDPAKKPAQSKALDPAFMGEFLVDCFLFNHFGLSDADLDELVAPLPESIRGAAKYWTVLYLSWVYSIKLRSTCGDAFLETALQTACARCAVLAETAHFGDELRFWFKQLDHAAANLGQTAEGVEIPMEYFAALTLLGLSPDSPFFRQTEFIGSGIELELAEVLAKGKKSALRLIDVAGEYPSLHMVNEEIARRGHLL
jgi:hypothetical protein